MPDTFLIDDVNGTLMAPYFNREVGDEEMFLDNLDLDRNALFQAQYKIIAGKEANPLYDYPNSNAQSIFISYRINGWPLANNPYNYNLPNNGIFSNDDPFRILTNNTAQLVAQNSILDVGMDIHGFVWQSLQPQFVCSNSYSDTAVYQKFFSEPNLTDVSEERNAIIFPNPLGVGELAEIRNIVNGAYTLQVFNLSGNLVWNDTYNSEFDKIRFPIELTSGLYIIKLTGQSNYNFKILIL